MIKKKYAFEGNYGRLWKLPIYAKFSNTNVKYKEDSEEIDEVFFGGEVELTGKNWITDKLLVLLIYIDITLASIKYTLNRYLNTNFKIDKGFYFTIKEIVELED